MNRFKYFTWGCLLALLIELIPIFNMLIEGRYGLEHIIFGVSLAGIFVLIPLSAYALATKLAGRGLNGVLYNIIIGFICFKYAGLEGVWGNIGTQYWFMGYVSMFLITFLLTIAPIQLMKLRS
ncbi:hypothetical protein J4H46_22920 [Vibrio alginolyticus]|uniref:hypothetical protein n=1 Tax=Vibrio alginolyticus TaxID=663 RepID=UPI001BD59488|nr:hypothetical protein [Vibrio alginolyticus]MBT0101390.1 hypothetical protein [Vibrio alginolyticus]MCS0228562.1 hypothetical protein [Vibrio alginolyticus]